MFTADRVTLPHNWNDYWGCRRYRHSCLHGEAKYECTFETDLSSCERAYLVFEGVGQYLTAEVNGQSVVSNRPAGKVTTTIDVTHAVARHGKNRLVVTCSHSSGIVDMPWICGGCSTAAGFCECAEPVGLFRTVRLDVTDEVRIAPFGVHVWGKEPFSTVTVDVEVSNDGASEAVRELAIRCAALGIDVSESVVVGSGERRTVRRELKVSSVRRWSAEEPNLYRFDVALSAEGHLDSASVETGFRTVSWPFRREDGDGRLFVNGKPTFLHGTCDADQLFGSNNAFGPEEIDARATLVHDTLGFNAIRDGHEPHDLRWGRNWDKLGLYWWPQFGTHVYYATDEFKRNYLMLLEQWVKERRNSPSVVLWGIQNESVMDPAFMREAVALVRRLDPLSSLQDRLCTSCNYGDGADWTVVQNWSGTYGGDLSRYGEEMAGPTQLLNGEYGAYRCLGFHGKFPEKFDSDGAWTEEQAAYILHQKLMQGWKNRHRICGHFQWLLFSHENPGRLGPDDGYRLIDKAGPVNNKGLLTMWGAPTAAFYAYAAYGRLLHEGKLDEWLGRPVEDMIAEGRRLLAPVKGAAPISLAGGPGRRYIYRLNCGGDEVVDACGQKWLADSTGFTRSWASDSEFAEEQLNPVLCSQGVVEEGVLNAKEADQEILSSYRWGRHRLRFDFRVRPKSDYLVEAWFVEPGGYGRMFDVAVNGVTVESRLDLPKDFGVRCAVRRAWHVCSDADGKLVVSFPRVQVAQAVVSAIAISEAASSPATTETLGVSGYPASAGLTWKELGAKVVGRTPESDNPKADERVRVPISAIRPIMDVSRSIFVLGLSDEYRIRFCARGCRKPTDVSWFMITPNDKRLIAQGEFRISGKKDVEVVEVPVGSFVNAGTYLIFTHPSDYTLVPEMTIQATDML